MKLPVGIERERKMKKGVGGEREKKRDFVRDGQTDTGTDKEERDR